MKTTRDYVNIIEPGSYRGAAELCGTTDKTVKRALERQQAGGPGARRPRLQARNTDPVLTVIAQKVKDTDGRITAKRLLPLVKAAGYEGSARNLRRAVASIKKEHRQKRRKANDIRDILAAGPKAPKPVAAGTSLHLVVPESEVRSLDAYALEAIR